jgi:CO dehydrogenase nickel-insertion accessory protein CooC1
MSKKARKIVDAVRNGGAGKTTTTANLSTALMLREQKVLVVDLDANVMSPRLSVSVVLLSNQLFGKFCRAAPQTYEMPLSR